MKFIFIRKLYLNLNKLNLSDKKSQTCEKRHKNVNLGNKK